MSIQLFDFHGGICPPEHKADSNAEPIRAAPIPQQLVIPLSQRQGSAARAIVRLGQAVRTGETIAEPVDELGVAVHASSSGVITAIDYRVTLTGEVAECIIIETDGIDRWHAMTPHPTWREYSPTQLIDLIQSAGIVGMGGAGFPTAYKLSASHVDTLIINGAECEPYITADDLTMRERAERVLLGAEILQQITAARRVLIAIEDNKAEAIEQISSALVARGERYQLATVPTRYPSGGEKQLIQLLTGEQVPQGGLPADIGVICHNIGTCVAIADAIATGLPLISRITTFTGGAIAQRGNLEVRIGTPLSYLLNWTGFDQDQCHKLLAGGSIMGKPIVDGDAPVTKTTHCILAATHTELPDPAPASPCIRCGLCAEACPAKLLPQQLYWYSKSRQFEPLAKYGLTDCIECGVCTYVCPSSIPLVDYFVTAKTEIKTKQNEQQRAEHARERFESRQARLARDANEKEAARAARKAQATANPEQSRFADQVDPVQAAIERAKAKKKQLLMAQPATPDPSVTRLELTSQLEVMSQRLSDAKLNNADQKILTALEASIALIQSQLSDDRIDESKPSDLAESKHINPAGDI
jgi:Na+-translocating ferredoxin:NAD+ oxidoreductase subunit C